MFQNNGLLLVMPTFKHVQAFGLSSWLKELCEHMKEGLEASDIAIFSVLFSAFLRHGL